MSDIPYLDRVAASTPGRAYKRRLTTALGLEPGQTVLEVGCGPATDLPELAAAVRPGGRVIGVDHDAGMVDAARRRLAGHSGVEVRLGDAHALPLPDASVDRTRVDRVLMHVQSPVQVLAELHRVLRPGGLAALAEPDWDTLVIDAEDLDTSRAYTRYVATRVVRNAAIGRQLARLSRAAGFTVVDVEATPVLLTDREQGDAILKPASVARRAVADGALTAAAVEPWLHDLATGAFLAAVTLFTVIARA